MTPRISLITAVAAAALVVGVPAAFGDSWASDRYDETGLVGSPDVVDRAVAARQQEELATMLDGRERALETQRGYDATSTLDARERAFATKREAQLAGGTGPDVFERAVAARLGRTPIVGDGGDRFRIDPTSTPGVTVGAVSSGREIEWPKIGFGVGLGILLALGLMLVLRSGRNRELVH